MVRVETEGSTESGRRISRRKLVKAAAVGGGLAYAAPFMTSTALAGPGDGHPRCNAVAGEDPKTCGPHPCFDQTICRGEIPDGSFCTCVPREPGNGNEQGEGQCFCHEAQFCAGLTACENSGDCPPGWACASSCCPGGAFCLPPCGTNSTFATTGQLVAAVGQGSTSVG
jgi:hypothetical protein